VSTARPAPTSYSVQLNLPGEVVRPLDAWATEAEGASIPAAGWHITLLPSFVSKAGEEKLNALLGEIAARHEPFPLHLSHIELVADRTRSGYSAVFLTEDDDGQNRRLRGLQSDLTETLAPLRAAAHPELEGAAFTPHVSLALAISEKEGERLASSARRASLTVAFEVDAIWLFRRVELTTGEVDLSQRRFDLGSAGEADLPPRQDAL